MDKSWGTLLRVEGHNGYWLDPASGVYYWRGTIDRRPIKVSTRAKKISEARKFVSEYLLRLTSDNFEKAKRELRGVRDPMLKDIWKECIGERQKNSQATKKMYELNWRIGLESFWGAKTISQVSEKTVKEFENAFIKNHPGKSFYQTRKHLKMLLNYLHREGYIKKSIKVTNLDIEVEESAKKEKHFRIYTEGEQSALIECAETEVAKLLLIGYFDTGARKEELLGLERSKINLEKETVTLWSAKNKEWREIPLTKRFKAALSAYIGATANVKSKWAFPMPSDPKRPIYGQLFDKEWVIAKSLAGVRGKARVHDIRHTVATKTANDNWPIQVACAMLDMSVQVYTETYCHIDSKDIFKHLRRSFG